MLEHEVLERQFRRKRKELSRLEHQIVRAIKRHNDKRRWWKFVGKHGWYRPLGVGRWYPECYRRPCWIKRGARGAIKDGVVLTPSTEHSIKMPKGIPTNDARNGVNPAHYEIWLRYRMFNVDYERYLGCLERRRKRLSWELLRLDDKQTRAYELEQEWRCRASRKFFKVPDLMALPAEVIQIAECYWLLKDLIREKTQPTTTKGTK